MIRFIKFDGSQPRVVTVPRWALGLGIVAAMLVGLLLLLLVAGLALVVIPMALVAGGVAAWIGRGKRVDPRPSRPPGAPEIIDAEYRVIERHEERR